jgi:CheY-like chemotaxis protein
MKVSFDTDKPNMRHRAPEDARNKTVLPMSEQPEDSITEPAFNLQLAEQPLRILLAEDNSVTQEVMLLMLSSLGYQADVAANGLEVMEAIDRQSYDVVLMDARMPELDGLQATKLIRAHTGSPVEPWIVAMTADDSPSDREACMAHGMNSFLPKPVRTDDLASVLGHVVADHAAQPAVAPAPTKNTEKPIPGFVDQNHTGSLCNAFVADARTALSDMVAYAATHDFDALRRKAHYLKGSSMIVGASRVTGLCREIEARATAQRPVEETLHALLMALETTAAELVSTSERSGASDHGQ